MIRKINNVYLLGTSHISSNSVEEITDAVKQLKPKFVCVELDKDRYFSLVRNEKKKPSLSMIKEIGLPGFVFLLIGGFIQKKLGSKVNVDPGADMLSAANEGKKIGSKIVLIDIPIRRTLKKFSSLLTFREKMRYGKELLSSLLFPKKKMQSLGLKKINLAGVPSLTFIKKILVYFEKTFPITYKILLEDRNKYMVQRINELNQKIYETEPTDGSLQDVILVVVGAGHLSGMLNLLSKQALE